MFLAVHSVASLIITSRIRHPLPAFAVGFASHFAVDAVPHGDESVGRWASLDGHQGVYRLAALALVDLAIVAVTCTWAVRDRRRYWVALAAVLGACLPDLMEGLETIVHQPLFGPFDAWHALCHNCLLLYLPFWLGLILQAAVAAGCWYRLRQARY